MLIQKLRLKRCWSQEHLAEASGLSVRTIQRIERGQPGSIESLKALAAVFEADVSTLSEEQAMATTTSPGTIGAEEEAFRHVRQLKRFYIHFGQYLFVVVAMMAINLLTNPDRLWFQWVALGWGTGVLAHAMAVFSPFYIFGPEWEKRQVEKRLGRPL